MKITLFSKNTIPALKAEHKYIEDNTNTSYFQCVDVVKAREVKALGMALSRLPEIDRIFFGEKISNYIQLFSWTEPKIKEEK